MKNIVDETRKYWENDFNCARAAARGILDYYNYQNLSEILDKALLPFGGGTGERSICGAVTGALAAISTLLVEKNIEDEKKKEVFRAFKDKFMEKNGTLYCREILKDFFLPDGSIDVDHPKRKASCDQAVETASLIAKELIDKL